MMLKLEMIRNSEKRWLRDDVWSGGINTEKIGGTEITGECYRLLLFDINYKSF